MDWETKLIATYFLVCDYSWIFEVYNERFSNNNTPKFTDSEVATIYIFCTVDDFKLNTKKSIHAYADRHLRPWFPDLPKYEAFSHRVNELGECFRHLTLHINEDRLSGHHDFGVVRPEFLGDSMPMVMAKGAGSADARVAVEIANSGYCATKGMHYHGLKLHNLNLMASESRLPHPTLSTLSSASAHDYEVFRNELPHRVRGSKCYLDSAYFDEGNKVFYEQEYGVTICAIEKRKRGQRELFADQKMLNTAFSRLRQPIEGYFNWIIELTGIQNASKTRATKGVLSHIYGKLAAATVFLAIFNF